MKKNQKQKYRKRDTLGRQKIDRQRDTKIRMKRQTDKHIIVFV